MGRSVREEEGGGKKKGREGEGEEGTLRMKKYHAHIRAYEEDSRSPGT